jgi:CelD/BcsL family acetyltransferase involved in cellulose biosynthesis
MPRARLIDPRQLSADDFDRWRDLERRAAVANPFQAPGFLAPALRELSDGEVSLLVAEGGAGRWLGCLPFKSVRGWHRVPLPGSALWWHDYHYLGVPLLDSEEAVDALAVLLRAARRGTFLGIDLVPAKGQFRDCLEAAIGEIGAGTVIFDHFERAALTRKGGELKLPFRSKRRYELNRLERRLGEELSAELWLHRHDRDVDWLDRFLEMESAGWKGRQGTALASNPRHAAFFREMGRHFIETGAWRLYSLEADGIPLAMLTAMAEGETLYLFKIAFDERYSRFSPGVLLHRATMRELDEQGGIMTVDTCAYPTNETANRLYPDRIPFETIALPAYGLKGAPSALMLRLAAAMKQRRQAARKE